MDISGDGAGGMTSSPTAGRAEDIVYRLRRKVQIGGQIVIRREGNP